MHSNTSPSASSLNPRIHRWAISLLFFVNGNIFGAWAVNIPTVKSQLSLSEGELGIGLFGMAIGGLVMMPLSGALIPRYGSRLVSIISGLCFVTMLTILLNVPSFLLLFFGLMVFGMSNGAMDIGMNAQASALEEHYEKPIMSSFHAFFSVGGLIGSSVGGFILSKGITPTSHVLGISLLFGILTLVAATALLPATTDISQDGPTFALPSGPLVGLGIVAFLMFFGEGAVMDWMTVYFRQTLELDVGTAAVGYAAFSLTMTIGRVFGDVIVQRLGGAYVVRVGAALSVLGLGSTLMFPQFWIATIGCGLIGLGMANIVPVVFSTAGKIPGKNTGQSIAAVATLGYCGFLAGPPMIGLTAEYTSLRTALGIVVVFALIVLVFATRIINGSKENSPALSMENS